MRVFALITAALVAALSSPALAWNDSEPGGERWPPIPGNTGIQSFYGRWQPDCNKAAWLDQGDIIIEPNGVLRYTAKEPYFPTQYRIIETTPYGVTLIVRSPADGKYGDLYWIWVLRYLRASYRTKEPYRGAINVCSPHPSDLDRAGFRWDFSDAELKDFWDKFATCNPALTRKSPGSVALGFQHWGEGWNQGCEIIHLTDP